ncbi:MAG: hypothetical protein WC928_03940 [Patescibacteria group bacterium]|jgi:hypothetical protein
MSKNLNKSFEKEKIELAPSSTDAGIEIEKIDQIKEVLAEKEPVGPEKSQEEKKPLEKSGEGATSSKKPSPTITSSEKERQQQIDKILSEGLNDIFLSMNPKEQKRFQEEGEETVIKINKLLSQTKIKVKKIIDLIKRWLKLIPKVNNYFLEQEAKIKADKIIELKK